MPTMLMLASFRPDVPRLQTMTELDTGAEVLYDENYSHLQEIVARSQHWLPRIKDAFLSYSEIARPLDLSGGDTLLDVGSGVGRPGHYLRHLGIQAINVDVNIAAHQAAGTLWDGRNTLNRPVVSDGSLHLPLRDDSVDAICSQDFFEHISPDRLDTALAEMGRVLKGDRMVHRITVTEEPENLYADPTHQTFWSASEWAAWFAARGWNTVAPTSRKTYAPRASAFKTVPYCHGYFLLERTSGNS